MKEVDYYPEISRYLIKYFDSNIGSSDYEIQALVGEVSSAINTLIANGYEANKELLEYAYNIQRLHLDIALLIVNKINGKFEIVIFEVKKVKTLGLAHLSQLIGYCLVSKCELGILLNIDAGPSDQLATILNTDKDLTFIHRKILDKDYFHKFGLMMWDSTTKKINYSNAGSIQTLPDLISCVLETIE